MADRQGVVFIAADVHHGSSESTSAATGIAANGAISRRCQKCSVRRTPLHWASTEQMTSGFASMVVATGGLAVVRLLSPRSPMMRAS